MKSPARPLVLQVPAQAVSPVLPLSLSSVQVYTPHAGIRMGTPRGAAAPGVVRNFSAPCLIVDAGTPRSHKEADDDWDGSSDSSEEEEAEEEQPSGRGLFGWFKPKPRLKKRDFPIQTKDMLGLRPRVTVVGPGAGVGMNGAVYRALKKEGTINIEVVGRSQMPYDHYPLGWPQGGNPPDLQTFAKDIIQQGAVARADCLVVGSRGGQVVLPTLWRELGDQVPPAVVINGGCAMDLPARIHWPASAVTFLLIGGQDYFKGGLSAAAYVSQAQSRSPSDSSTTAVLYVEEMGHMPAGNLLKVVLEKAIPALLQWKKAHTAPVESFAAIVSALGRHGFHGQLAWTKAATAWDRLAFPTTGVNGATAQDVATGAVGTAATPAKPANVAGISPMATTAGSPVIPHRLQVPAAGQSPKLQAHSPVLAPAAVPVSPVVRPAQQLAAAPAVAVSPAVLAAVAHRPGSTALPAGILKPCGSAALPAAALRCGSPSPAIVVRSPVAMRPRAATRP